MTTRPRRRGQPLIVLSGIMLGWFALRAAAWSLVPVSGEELPLSAELAAPTAGWAVTAVGQLADQSPDSTLVAPPGAFTADVAAGPQFDADASSHFPEPVPTLPQAIVPVWNLQLAPLPPRPVQTVPGRSLLPAHPPKGAMRMVAGHQLLYAAALSALPLPAEVAALEARRAAAQPGQRRWSADGWLLWRRGSTGLVPTAPLGGSYGASQAGAVLRYRLTEQNQTALTAYLRMSAPLGQSNAAELALGLQAQPLQRVPLRTFAEVRGDRISGRARARFSGGVITAMAPLQLPLGFQAEPYGQAGYVSGPGETWFADGQLRADRRVLRRGRAELRAGAGVWGGAQRDAARLDAGPGLTLSFPLGPAQARLSADWRYRVAGTAAPGSGLAVTLATGF